jgi:hypothetical protein
MLIVKMSTDTENTENTEYLAFAKYLSSNTGLEYLECIFAYQTMKESGVFSVGGRPLTLSDKVKLHYGVKTWEEMIGKSISFLRRKKDENGKYLSPSIWYIQKSTIKEILDLEYGINFATVTVQNTEDGTIKERVRVDRICIA